MRKIVQHSFRLVVIVFAVLGLGFVSVYFAVKYGLTNTSGIIDQQNEAFWQSAESDTVINKKILTEEKLCRLNIIKKKYPLEAKRLAKMLLGNMGETVDKAINNSLLVIDPNNNNCDGKTGLASAADFNDIASYIEKISPYAWVNSQEWETFREAVSRDQDVLKRVEKETGVKSRLLVAELMAEQLRLFYSERDLFERVFAPIKILGSQTQFSWGIMGLKPDTAIAIEKNLKDITSPFYLGSQHQNTLNFKTSDIDQERFERITDEHNHYYAYLYSAMYNLQIINQWKKSNVDISNRPEILATLYNIGFANSVPKADPQIGGAELDIAGQTYSFGRLANEFYYSDELTDLFPY
jgi:hypothetical protein